MMTSSAALYSTPFFAFSFGFKGMEPHERVTFLAEAGYDGIAANVWNEKTLGEFAGILDTDEVRSGEFEVFGVYMPLVIDRPESRELVTRVLELGKVYRIPIWLAMKVEGIGDEATIEFARSVAEEADGLGTRVFLYPHDNHRYQSVEETMEVLEKANHPNLSTTLLLNHELRYGNAGRLEEVVAKAASVSSLVVISGAVMPENVNRHSRDWSDVVKPLSESVYDVRGFLDLTKKYGYGVPVGLMNFGIEGDPREHHLESLRIFREWERERLERRLRSDE